MGRDTENNQTACSYGLRLRAIGADHGDRMCASCGQFVRMTGDGEGGAAVLGHHTDGTAQGLQVFRGQADLSTGETSCSVRGGLSTHTGATGFAGRVWRAASESQAGAVGAEGLPEGTPLARLLPATWPLEAAACRSGAPPNSSS